MGKMTKKQALAEAIERFEYLSKKDQECAHCGADGVLLDYLRKTGSEEVANAYEQTRKKVGGFWYA